MKNQRRYPVIENAGNIITEACNQKLGDLYGNTPPQEIAERLAVELSAIIQYNNGTVYLIAKHLTDRAREAGQPTGARGGIGSSFVAFLLDTIGVNPLRPHYHCKACRYVAFVPGAASGFDLPDNPCPQCGDMMTGDGHDIPFEAFGGVRGETLPDIDLNFTTESGMKGKEILCALFPNDMIVNAGVINERRNQIGQHPGGWMIIPREYADEVPIAHIYHGAEHIRTVTAQNFHALTDRYYKQDILSHSALDRLYSLTSETGVSLESVPMNDPQVHKAFHDGDTQGVFEFETMFVLGMLNVCKPKCFSDLVKVSGLSHGTDVWHRNAAGLIESGVATLQEVIAAKDDIFNLLVSKGMARESAYMIMEIVRMGNAEALPENLFDPYDLPDWYWQSCKKITYLFPKAHAVSYVKMAVQMMWFKIYHPDVFNRIAEDLEHER